MEASHKRKFILLLRFNLQTKFWWRGELVSVGGNALQKSRLVIANTYRKNFLVVAIIWVMRTHHLLYPTYLVILRQTLYRNNSGGKGRGNSFLKSLFGIAL